MDVDIDHACETGLALGLGCGGGRPATNPCRQPPNPPLEPSLTLSLSDEIYGPPAISKAADDQASAGSKRRLSSPHSSTVSSLSTSTNIKKERVDFLGGSDEAEVERGSYRASDEEAEDALAARKKLRLTKEQSALLEDRFKEHSSLNPKQKQTLARQLNLQPRQVEVWFQNRRARTKLKQTEVDCEFLRRCCETLTEENRRLQKELQELKALKFAAPPSPPPPIFMQLPAATLTLCPSCERISEASGSAVNKADSIDGGGMFMMKAAKARHFFSPFTAC